MIAINGLVTTNLLNISDMRNFFSMNILRNQFIQQVYHSTLDCPNIRNGVEMDGYGYYYTTTKGKVPYTFCSKCMTDFLISECESKITSAYPEDVKN